MTIPPTDQVILILSFVYTYICLLLLFPSIRLKSSVTDKVSLLNCLSVCLCTTFNLIEDLTREDVAYKIYETSLRFGEYN